MLLFAPGCRLHGRVHHKDADFRLASLFLSCGRGSSRSSISHADWLGSLEHMHNNRNIVQNHLIITTKLHTCLTGGSSHGHLAALRKKDTISILISRQLWIHRAPNLRPRGDTRLAATGGVKHAFAFRNIASKSIAAFFFSVFAVMNDWFSSRERVDFYTENVFLSHSIMGNEVISNENKNI
jgi:hypothetical protein